MSISSGRALPVTETDLTQSTIRGCIVRHWKHIQHKISVFIWLHIAFPLKIDMTRLPIEESCSLRALHSPHMCGLKKITLTENYRKCMFAKTIG